MQQYDKSEKYAKKKKALIRGHRWYDSTNTSISDLLNYQNENIYYQNILKSL